MSVVLLNAHYDPGDNPLARMHAIGTKVTVTPHLAITYLGAALLQDGFEVRCADLLYDKEQLATVLRSLSAWNVGIVGISCVTSTYPAAVKIGAAVHAIDPSIKVVVGGHHVTYLDDEALQTGAFDIVVRHEGEYALVEIARNLLRGEGRLEDILGISFVADDGSTARTAARPPNVHLDALPLPARHLMPREQFNKMVPQGIPLISGRGCVYRCHYCAAGAYNQKSRRRSVANVMAEIDAIKEMGFDFLRFDDENLFAYGPHLDDFLREIRKRNVRWGANIVASTRVNRELLLRCKEAGADGFLIGVESGSDAILAELKRPNRIATILKVAEDIRSLGLTLEASFMIGHAGDTPETLEQTEAVLRRMKSLGSQPPVNINTPFPGTYNYINAEALGIKILHRQWELYTLGTSVIDTRHLTADQLNGFRRRMQAQVLLGDSPLTALAEHFDPSSLKNLGSMANVLEKMFDRFS